ncbi:MAG: insulinase family protein [Bacteroidetes bacterium]|nr:insulinase family protein [Bacteroidota bacterium]
MKKIISLVIVFISVLYLSINVNANTEKDFLKVQKFVLENGFTVFINEDPTQTEVMGGVIIKAGGKNDPADHTGIAHYLEHMLFKGTTQMGTIDFEQENVFLKKIYELYEQLGQTTNEEERKAIQKEINENSLKAGEFAILNEMDNLLRSIGSDKINAFTSEEVTFYFNSFPANQFEPWAEIYSHRFIAPVFRAFQAELEVVYEEKNMYNDNFGTALLEMFNSNFYKNHPYGQQTILGSIEHLKNPSLNKMYDFYNTYYVANNMALVISGDIKAENIMPIVEKKFGQLRSGVVPEFPLYPEAEFNGRELINARLTPVKVGLIGFRNLTATDPDRPAMEVAMGLLSNSSSTGLLDKLTLDGKLMAAMSFPLMANNDYGQTIILYVPKIIGQSLKKAEKIVLDEVYKIGKGQFEDDLFQGVKNSKIKDYYSQIEDSYSRGVYIALAFSQGIDPNDAFRYNEEIQKVTREDVIRVANKYFGPNYLVLHSKMGFPKKEKLDKPGYDPIQSLQGEKSVFAKSFEEIQAGEPVFRFVDLNNDFKTYQINNHTTVYYNENPLNKIFSVHMRFFVGEEEMPSLKYSSQMMNMAGTSKMNMSEIKEKLQLLGCTYSISSDENYVNINISGLEDYMQESVMLILDLLNDPIIEQSRIKVLHNQESAGRKLENADPSGVGSALLEFVRKGEKSDYIDRLSLKEIKKLKASDLTNNFKAVYDYPLDIHVTASKEYANRVQPLFASFGNLAQNPKPAKSPHKPKMIKYEENTVYFVDKKNALQSQIFIIANGEEYSPEQEYLIEVFNEYFGGGFSGLVMQEIREYRSMAYSAGAYYNIPLKKGFNSDLIGFIGTQSDKTIDAINIYLGLLKDMPQKTERMDILKQSMVQSVLTSRPNFRRISASSKLWKLRGFEDDPNKIKLSQYESMTFEDLYGFYERTFKNKPYVVCVVGDAKSIDVESLKSFGKFVELKEKDIFSK